MSNYTFQSGTTACNNAAIMLRGLQSSSIAAFCGILLTLTTFGCEPPSGKVTLPAENATAAKNPDKSDKVSPADKREAREDEFRKEAADPLTTPVSNQENSDRSSPEVGYGDKSEVEIMREKPRLPRIAILGPLTGELEYYGVEAMHGAELASEELDTAGGVNGEEYELLVIDSQSSIAGVQAAVETLFEYQTLAIVGAGTGEVSFAANKMINENQLIKLSAGSRRRLGDTGPYNFRNSLDDGYAIDQMIAYIKTEKKWRRFALFSSVVDDYSVKLSAYFKASLLNADLAVSHELFLWSAGMANMADDDTSIAAQVKQMKSNPPDAVVFTGSATEAVELIAQLRAHGIHIPLIGPEDIAQDEFIALGEKAAGSIIYSGFNVESTNETVRRFVTTYSKKYGTKPTRLAALAYDSFNMLVQAAKITKSLRPSHMRKALAEVKNFPGVTGPTSMNEVGESIKEPYIFEFKKTETGYRFVAVKEPF